MDFKRESLTQLALKQLATLLFWIFQELLRRCDYQNEWKPTDTFRARFSAEFAEEFDSLTSIPLPAVSMVDAATQTDADVGSQEIPSPRTPDPSVICFVYCESPGCRFQCMQTTPHARHLCDKHR